MAKKDNTIIWIIVGIVLILLIGPKLGLNIFSIFSEEPLGSSIAIKSPRGTLDFTQGDQIVIDISKEVGYSATGYLIFVDDKLFKSFGRGSFGVHYGSCPEPWGNMYNQYNNCDKWQYSFNQKFQCQANDPRTLDPVWEQCSNITLYAGPQSGGSTYTSPNGLQAGNFQKIEAYVFATSGQSGTRLRSEFIINVAGQGSSSNNTRIITLTMKNTGGQKLTDLTLNPVGTTPPVLYNQFSNLNKFSLNPNEQAIFYSNIDTSTFNGQVPFQMMFNTRYSTDGGRTNYSLVKYTEPLILTFQNGQIIP